MLKEDAERQNVAHHAVLVVGLVDSGNVEVNLGTGVFDRERERESKGSRGKTKDGLAELKFLIS